MRSTQNFSRGCSLRIIQTNCYKQRTVNAPFEYPSSACFGVSYIWNLDAVVTYSNTAVFGCGDSCGFWCWSFTLRTRFMLSSASSSIPRHTSPFFSSTVTIPPSASCRRMIGMPMPALPVTDTTAAVAQARRVTNNDGERDGDTAFA